MAFINWMKRLRERYWKRITIGLAIACWVLFIVASQVGQVGEWLIASGALQLLILTLLLDASGTLAQLKASRETRISSNENESSTQLFKDLVDMPLRTADLLEFSGVSVYQLITALVDRRCEMRMLVKHPDSVGEFQSRRITSNLESLYYRFVKGGAGNLNIKCYWASASLRGRRLGEEIINVGWYTPDIQNGQLLESEVVGDGNPLITARIKTHEGQDLLRMFNQVFDGLWEAEDSEAIHVVLRRRGYIVEE
jgi:hypothetical protein